MKASALCSCLPPANDPQINPLEAAAASKNKSKDIHLTNLEVNVASNRILSVCPILVQPSRNT
jgi:hypothetical protein